MSLKSQLLLSALLVGSTLAAAPPVAAQSGYPTLREEAETIEQKADTGLVDPASVDALKAMGGYVSGIMSFELTSNFEVDLVLDDGQLVQLGGSSHYLVRRPDRLRVELTTDTGNREFFYDGQSLLVFAPDDEVYARLNEVGPTIRQMLHAVDYYADVEVPLAELFSLGTSDTLDQVLTEGFLVGPSSVNGVAATHWAYRTESRDVQFWIQDGDAPLPLKVVVDDRVQAGKPRFTATLTWNTEAKPAEADFAFTPPAGVTEVAFAVRDPDAESAGAPAEEAAQ